MSFPRSFPAKNLCCHTVPRARNTITYKTCESSTFGNEPSDARDSLGPFPRTYVWHFTRLLVCFGAYVYEEPSQTKPNQTRSHKSTHAKRIYLWRLFRLSLRSPRLHLIPKFLTFPWWLFSTSKLSLSFDMSSQACPAIFGRVGLMPVNTICIPWLGLRATNKICQPTFLQAF